MPISMPLFAWVAIAVSSIAAMPGNVLPVLTTLLGGHHHIDEATVGYLISVNTFAGLVASATGPYWIGRVSYRPVMAVCFVVHAACLVGLGIVRGIPALLVLQVFLGSSALVIASITQTIFAQLPRPERAFGIKISTDMVFAALFLASVPVARVGLPGFLGPLGIAFLLAAIATPLLPRALDEHPPRAAGLHVRVPELRAPLSVWVALLAMVMFNVGGLGVWTFVGRFGIGAGLGEEDVANIVAIGLLSGIAGALGAAAYAGRRSIVPEVVAGVIWLLSIPAHALARDAFEFTAANVALNVCWNFFAPFLVGIVARRDTTRRLNTLVPACVMVGGIVGPALAGTLLHSTNTLVTALTMMAIAAPSIAIYIALMREPRDHHDLARR